MILYLLIWILSGIIGCSIISKRKHYQPWETKDTILYILLGPVTFISLFLTTIYFYLWNDEDLQ